jgi:polar amino acid transport system permease protein
MNYQFQFDAVFAAWPLLLKGTWITVQLSLIATVLGLVVAIGCAWGKTSGPGWLRFVVNAYIEVIRNTPFLVQLFFFFFALPALGPALVAAHGRAGGDGGEPGRLRHRNHPRRHRVDPKGQIEAGLALNLKRLGDLPLRHHQAGAEGHLSGAHQPVHPADAELGVVSVISADDLTSVAANLQSQTFRSFEIYIVVAAIYLALALAFSGMFKLIYKRTLNYPDRR